MIYVCELVEIGLLFRVGPIQMGAPIVSSGWLETWEPSSEECVVGMLQCCQFC